jgi:hypothetical protein
MADPCGWWRRGTGARRHSVQPGLCLCQDRHFFLEASLDSRARTLRFFETATGHVSDLHRFTRRVMDFTLRPNEGGILYTHDGLDLWLAENFQ